MFNWLNVSYEKNYNSYPIFVLCSGTVAKLCSSLDCVGSNHRTDNAHISQVCSYVSADNDVFRVQPDILTDRHTQTQRERECLAACFIKTTLANVPDPLHHIMVAVVQLRLEHFQIANLEARRSKRHLCVMTQSIQSMSSSLSSSSLSLVLSLINRSK